MSFHTKQSRDVLTHRKRGFTPLEIRKSSRLTGIRARICPARTGGVNLRLPARKRGISQGQFLTGFTLIELLVVIAIIGILSSVVLASLNTARTRGKEAAIKSSLSSIRVEAELQHSDDFSAMCETTGNTIDTNAGGNLPRIEGDIEGNDGAVTCYADTNDYAVSSTLPDGGNWCVDSSGESSAECALDSVECGTCP